LRNYPDIRFILLGQGSKWDWMRQEIERRKLENLHLVGRFSVETMPGLMAKSQALLVTLADRPIFAATVPNKIQAYMAVGRPIIASLNGEGARIVNEAGAGVTATAENTEALAHAVLKLYQMTSEDRLRMGQRGRSYFLKHFEHEKLIQELISTFEELAGEKI
jgi:glycosyltransferase involved in cell wall biosynthesis